MPKIMLVEDDNNLREIYEARLLAEGYEIVSAKDGEEALALAVKEKPDLIISDVMMPKISGFDMLDILRSTPETKNAKVIMMTALSQAEDKSRADKLGADRYLVKSQVTLEDVAKVAREVLNGEDSTPPAAKVVASADQPANIPPPTAPTPPAASAPAVTPVAVAPAPDPTPPPEPPTPPAADPPTPPAPSPPAEPPTTSPPPPEPPVKPAATTSESPVTGPVIDPAQAQTAASEEAAIDKQINQFINNLPTQAPPAVTPAPDPTPPAQAPPEPPVSTPPPATPPEPVAPTPPAQPEEPTPDPTVQAAADAANLAHTVNDIFDKKDTQTTPKAVDTTTAPGGGSTSIAGKKIIKPLNDISTQGPDLNKLLEKEQQATSVAPPPATSVVAPSGETVTPAAPNKAPDNHAPGNVIQPGGPGGVDPNSIAL